MAGLNLVDVPPILYHGTTKSFTDALERDPGCLINPDFWKPNRDFGEGFYTTTDLPQAKAWAIDNTDFDFLDARVLVIRCNPDKIPTPKNDDQVVHRVYIGATYDWSKYILEHRINEEKGMDPCYPRPELHGWIVTGPMADSITGTIVKELRMEYLIAKRAQNQKNRSRSYGSFPRRYKKRKTA
jgi:hypothetical protein